METSKLRKFACFARSALIEQVGTRLKTVLAEKSIARRESPNAVKELEAKIKELGEKRLIETVAYTWFNRFCALRYMDVNRYTRIGVLSPADGQFQPEILAEAKMGHIDEELVPEVTRKQVMRLLDGSDKSADPQGEAYRLLLVAVCNYYHALMPFMFERIADYTELLLPDDLLSGASIPAYTREALLPINCSPKYTEESVEVIGWLYQFYIADKKDQVFESLSKGTKITAENIPAATQLFTPHWIVRYLVENSLGRLWMLNHPDSTLIERMDYYIKPEEPETDFLKIANPEEIKVCDPACGSGHMLTYAFDLLYEIYREEQYAEPEIPSLILRNNLFGIEIDQRAGALAAFALTMKALEKDKRFFTRKPQVEASTSNSASIASPSSKIQNPNICVLENIKIDSDDLSAYMVNVGRDLFSGGLQGVVNQWEEADNFGSLIRPHVADVSEVLELLREHQMGQDLFLADVHQKVLKALRQADYLSPKYHVVVANPPYMGGKGMNAELKAFAKEQFQGTRSDLFAMFIERNVEIALSRGFVGMITMQSWMFLGSYEEFRHFLLTSVHIESMVHLGTRAFDTIGGEIVSTTAFILCKQMVSHRNGCFFRLIKGNGEVAKRDAFINTKNSPYNVSGERLLSIPGAPIAYWLSEAGFAACANYENIGSFVEAKSGMSSCNSDRFLRIWHEVSCERISRNSRSHEEARESKAKWFPYNKGGGDRRWYGYNEVVINWLNDGAEIKHFVTNNPKDPDTTHWSRRLFNLEYFFQPGFTWSAVTTSGLSCRFVGEGVIPGTGSKSVYGLSNNLNAEVIALLNSKVATYFLEVFSPTMNFEGGDVVKVPFHPDIDIPSSHLKLLESLSRDDWDASETSCDFQRTQLVACKGVISEAYQKVRTQWLKTVNEMRSCEEELNKSLIHSYGLEDELSSEVAIFAVTLNCNPSYRYGTDKSEIELEALLIADTMREFISYAVGCMFGRFSLDKPGLILANQGETAADYRKQIPEPTFAPDEDNVIPLLDGDWFEDDITESFKAFLKVTFGTEHYEENLKFLEDALYPDNATAKKRKTLRGYFLKDFYHHHIKLYKKRPIYWLFSSPKGTFNALIYMHRYRPDTVGTVLHYLREFRDKLTHHADHRQMLADSASASKSEKTQAIKDVASIKKQLKELEDYEKTLFEIAARKIDIDLDDGVEHNYQLFDSVLRKIPGLYAKGDE